MAFADSYNDTEQARRFRNRSILLFIILATLPCYVVGGILLGVAPNEEAVESSDRTVPAPLQSTSQIDPGETTTLTLTTTVTLDVTPTPSETLPPTPGQFRTPTPFPTQPLPTNTLAPSLTIVPSSTATIPATASATATEVNQAPVFVPDGVEPLTLELGAMRTIEASDPDGDSLSVTALSADPTIVSITFVESGFVITANAVGSTTVAATATDTREQETQVIFTVTVSDTNRDPVFVPPPAENLSVNVGESVTVTLSVNDPDGDLGLSYDVAANPTGIVSFSGVDDSDYQFMMTGQSAGVTQVTIQLSDGNGGSASHVIAVTVNEAPAQNNPPSIDSVLPNPLSLVAGDSTFVTVQATDTDDDTLTLSPTNNNPELMTVSPVDNTTFTVLGVAAGTGTITVRVSDGEAEDTATLTVTITAANQAPQLSQPVPDTLELGAAEVEAVVLQYSDPNPEDNVTLTVTSNDPNVVMVTKQDNSNFTVTAVGEGSANVRVFLDDGAGGTVEEFISVTVLP